MPGFELIDNKEKKAMQKLFTKDKGILFAHGFDKIRKSYHVREFENKIKNYTKAKYCLAVTSGTAAIKISLLAMGVKSGDEIITQAFNFIATAEAINDIGAKVIICNVDESLNMCPADLKRKINKRTKAIIPVHMLGVSAEMNQIKKIARSNKIKICEDVCEAFGGSYNNKSLGMIGDCGILSFDFGKIITTGEGGAIITNNKKIYNFSKQYHDHGHQNKFINNRGNDTAKIFGFNYRMTEMQGIIGKVQLERMSLILKQNKKRYDIMYKYLKEKFNIRKIPKNSISNYEAFIFSVEKLSLKKKIIKILKKNKLGTKNLPDAIKWHCSYYWKRGLPNTQIKNSIKTKNKLIQMIAVPIFLKKKTTLYSKVSRQIIKVSS